MYLPFYHEVLHYLCHRLGDRDKAQELTQEAFSRLERHRQRSELPLEQHNPRALFFATARNLLIDQHRQNQLQQPQPAEVLPETDTLPAGRQADPEVQLAAQQQLARVYQQLAALPLATRQAFVMFKFQGQSYAQIADSLGVSVSMVEKHLIRAMQAARQAVQSAEQGQGAEQ
jgi:RNA polymerase sigma-70 factor (ECF subfamily)